MMKALLVLCSLAVSIGAMAASPIVVQQGSDCRLSESITWTHDDSIPVDGFSVWASRYVDAEGGRRSIPLDSFDLTPGLYKIYIMSHRDRITSRTSGGPVLVQVEEPAGGFCTQQ